MPFTKNEEVWFARSGAVMVLLAVIVEYRLNNEVVKKISNTIQTAILTKLPITVSIQKERKLIAKITHSFVILGTLIWGYGDLIK